MKVLVINSGSSSIKYELFDMQDRKSLATGIVERIGEDESCLTHKTRRGGEIDEITDARAIVDHAEGLQLVLETFAKTGCVLDDGQLLGIGHRVVHGGEAFREPVLINDEVIATIRELVPLAPLHNGANLMGIEAAMLRFGDIPQVAVFDTAFHQSIPPRAFRYALPDELYNVHHVRRYGFHGTSYKYVSARAAEILGKPADELNLIVLHLGNGASAAAIQRGRSIDTSMGMTPLEGLIMGTRCGDIDPSIAFYLGRKTGRDVEEIESLLNEDSGLKGICGAGDMREVRALAEAGNDKAKLAIEMYCYRVKKYIGAYFAALGSDDAIVFTAGIGENQSAIRAGCCEGLSAMGIDLDAARNETPSATGGEISSSDSAVKVMVIETDEELEIAEQTALCIESLQSPTTGPAS